MRDTIVAVKLRTNELLFGFCLNVNEHCVVIGMPYEFSGTTIQKFMPMAKSKTFTFTHSDVVSFKDVDDASKDMFMSVVSTDDPTELAALVAAQPPRIPKGSFLVAGNTTIH